MTPQQKRGRIYLVTFIVVLVLLDLGLKGVLLGLGVLRWSQVVGTAITLLTCWFLWRGSGFAYGFMLFCLAVAFIFALAAASQLPLAALALVLVMLALFLLALAAPATRSFIAYQRQGSA